MTNKTEFENKNGDIVPGFMKDDDTQTTSVDMSIFKMSEDELYDEPLKKETKNVVKEPKKKSGSSTLLIVLCILLFVVSAVAGFIAFKEHSKVSDIQAQLDQAVAQTTDYQNQISSLNSQIADLNKQLDDLKNIGTFSDPDKKYVKGTDLYITEEGQSMGYKKKPSVDSEFVDSSILNWGDKVTLINDAVLDKDGNYWGETDKGFIRIVYNGKEWASTEKQ